MTGFTNLIGGTVEVGSRKKLAAGAIILSSKSHFAIDGLGVNVPGAMLEFQEEALIMSGIPHKWFFNEVVSGGFMIEACDKHNCLGRQSQMFHLKFFNI